MSCMTYRMNNANGDVSSGHQCPAGGSYGCAELVALLLALSVFAEFHEELAGVLEDADHVLLDLVELLDAGNGGGRHVKLIS